MKYLHDLIRTPLITEKTTSQKALNNSVTFKVDIKATKEQIKRAVEKVFSVKVLEVHTIKILGKNKRLGRFLGKRADWKKAIVTLKPGDKIEYFEGV
jgi:large subunit ribosomal protein L23